MDIQRKGVDKIKITHNKGLLVLILILIVLLAGVIYFILKNNNSDNIPIEDKECSIDSECVASSCCHAKSCIAREKVSSETEVSEEKAPLCDKVFCTQECSGPLDCGAGHCGCVNGKCSVVADSEIF